MQKRKKVKKCPMIWQLSLTGFAALAGLLTIMTLLLTSNVRAETPSPISEPVTLREIAALSSRRPASENTDLSKETGDPASPTVVDRLYTDEDALLLALIIEAEYGGCHSDAERSGVGWTVLNRVDNPNYPNTIREVIFEPHQFAVEYMDETARPDILSLSYDILDRWSAENNGATEVGRTLPPEALYFWGDGTRNYFNDGKQRIFVPDKTIYNT